MSATFYEANSLNALDKKAEALKVFRKLAKKRTDNPYRDAADFYIAESLSKAGAKSEALEVYTRLGDEADKADLQAESTVKAAAIAAELGRDEVARKLFAKALAKPAIGDWRGVAKLGAIRLAYEAGEFDEPAALTTKEIGELPKEAIPEAMLISANAKRQLGQKEGAIALYEQILAEYPDSDAAGSARFQRLVSLDQTDGADMLAQVDEFLAKSTGPAGAGKGIFVEGGDAFQNGQVRGGG